MCGRLTLTYWSCWWTLWLIDDLVHSPSSISSMDKATSVIGREKCQSLIGFHNFTSAEWGGTFVGISKKSWFTSYLSFPNDDPIVSAFKNHELVDCAAHREFCLLSIQLWWYIPALCWELFRSRNLEDERLPPRSNTDAPYLTHQLCDYEGQQLYNTSPMPTALEENGWMHAGDEYVPVRRLYKPAPVAVLELIKCGCKTSCKGHCSCKNNHLPCTALWKCHNSECSNLPDYRMIAYEDEDDVWLLQDEQGWHYQKIVYHWFN